MKNVGYKDQYLYHQHEAKNKNERTAQNDGEIICTSSI